MTEDTHDPNNGKRAWKANDGVDGLPCDDDPDGSDPSVPSDGLDDEELAGSGFDPSFFRPVHGWKVWVILTGIFIAIGVGVLYVYQAGDRKTILGNQPIPAEGLYASPAPVAFNVPVGGLLHAHPAHRPAGNAATGSAAASSSPVTCRACGASGFPVCAGCGAVMKSIDNGTGAALYACPACGAVGVPVCPTCRTTMASAAAGSKVRPAAAIRPVAAAGGQFYCPTCRATGLPNWNPSGVPICPSCRAQMQVR